MLTRLHEEDGVAGGFEALPFGVLVFVIGTLLITNAWAVVDAKMAVTSAAREAARAFVETPAGTDPHASAARAAREALVAYGRADQMLTPTIDGVLARCERVAATVRTRVPAVVLPWVGGLGAFTASSTASEVVDPLRSGLDGEATCLAQ
jgi:hypothetical protein